MCIEDFRYHPIGCIWAIARNILADVIDIGKRFWVEGIPSCGLRTAALGFGLFAQEPICFLTVDRLHPSAFEFVEPASQGLARICYLVKVADHRVFYKRGTRPPALARHLVKPCLHVGFEVDFH